MLERPKLPKIPLKLEENILKSGKYNLELNHDLPMKMSLSELVYIILYTVKLYNIDEVSKPSYNLCYEIPSMVVQRSFKVVSLRLVRVNCQKRHGISENVTPLNPQPLDLHIYFYFKFYF